MPPVRRNIQQDNANMPQRRPRTPDGPPPTFESSMEFHQWMDNERIQAEQVQRQLTRYHMNPPAPRNAPYSGMPSTSEQRHANANMPSSSTRANGQNSQQQAYGGSMSHGLNNSLYGLGYSSYGGYGGPAFAMPPMQAPLGPMASQSSYSFMPMGNIPQHMPTFPGRPSHSQQLYINLSQLSNTANGNVAHNHQSKGNGNNSNIRSPIDDFLQNPQLNAFGVYVRMENNLGYPNASTSIGNVNELSSLNQAGPSTSQHRPGSNSSSQATRGSQDDGFDPFSFDPFYNTPQIGNLAPPLASITTARAPPLSAGTATRTVRLNQLSTQNQEDEPNSSDEEDEYDMFDVDIDEFMPQLHPNDQGGLNDLLMDNPQQAEVATAVVWEAGHPLSQEDTTPKEICDSFGPEGLKDEEEEITDIEEMVFQRVLRKKLVCDICMTHMKRFRCSKCFYAMCSNCVSSLQKDYANPGITPCPQCRLGHKQFMPVILPRF